MGVATAIAIGGLALTAATTTMSFINAGKAKSKQRQAEASAAAAMQTARGKLEQNFALEEAVNKNPYELEREAMLSLGSQQIQAGVESDRGAAATAGQVMMGQNLAQAGITGRESAEISGIKQRQIAEKSRLRDLGVQLDLGEVEGQQQMARQAQAEASAQKAQGIQGAISMGQQGLNMLPLYFKDGGNPQVESASPESGMTQAPKTYGIQQPTQSMTPLSDTRTPYQIQQQTSNALAKNWFYN